MKNIAQKVVKNSQKTLVFMGVFAFFLIIAHNVGASTPVVTTNPVTITSPTTIILRGYINTGGISTSYWFELGENNSQFESFGNRRTKTSQDVKIGIVNIDPKKTYYFRAVAQNNDGKSYGQTLSFNTASGNTSVVSNGGSSPTSTGNAPIVATTLPSNITDISVTFNGFIDPESTYNTSQWFEWGTSYALGNISGLQSAGSAAHNFSHSVTGLQKNTTYYFRAVGKNSAGTVNGTIMSFTTSLIYTPPVNPTPIVPTVINTTPPSSPPVNPPTNTKPTTKTETGNQTTKTEEKSTQSEGTAGVFFAKTSMALLGWFAAIILLIISIVLATMLKRCGNKNGNSHVDKFADQTFKEFPPEIAQILK